MLIAPNLNAVITRDTRIFMQFSSRYAVTLFDFHAVIRMSYGRDDSEFLIVLFRFSKY